MKPAVASSPSNAISVYIRVSWLYAVMNGLSANSTAAISAARRPHRLHATHAPAGTHRVPNRSDMACVAVSLEPNTLIQMWSSM